MDFTSIYEENGCRNCLYSHIRGKRWVLIEVQFSEGYAITILRSNLVKRRSVGVASRAVGSEEVKHKDAILVYKTLQRSSINSVDNRS